MTGTDDGRRTACMVAYTRYANDARVKRYVHALAADGYAVDVYVPSRGAQQDSAAGVRFITVESNYTGRSAVRYILAYLLFCLKVFPLLTAQHLKRRYRFVHVHNMPDFLVFVALVPKLLGAKIILDVHDTMPEAYASKFNVPLGHPLIRLIRLEERLSGAFADQIITTNDLQKLALVSHGHAARKIALIMNVADEQIFFPRRPEAGCSGGDSTLTLAYHGTIAHRTGVDLILEAIARAQPRCPGLRFLLLGPNNDNFVPVVLALIAEHDLEDVVMFGGNVPVESLPGYLAPVDVGVVGNRSYTELHNNWMLPVKMLEYTAMEIPTIAPRLKVIARYFDDSNAILYEPDSAEDLAACIADVYAHREKLEALTEGMRAFNREYNWTRMSERYFDIVGEPEYAHARG